MELKPSDRRSGIYQIRNLVNSRVYVGSAVNLANRRKEHLSNLRRGKHHSPKLQNAWLKYGEDAFVFEVLEVVDCRETLLEAEQRHIDALSAVKCGYNVSPTAGSTLGRKLSDETRAKMRDAQQALPMEVKRNRARTIVKLERTDAWKAKIASSMTGRKFSEEEREKMSASAKARGAEANARIAQAIRDADLLRGGRHSEGSKAKISQALKGRTFSEEHRAAIKAAWDHRKAAQTLTETPRKEIDHGSH